MKNILLFTILIFLVITAYFLDHKKSKLLFKDISFIKTETYIIEKKDNIWTIGKQVIDESFMNNYLEILKSIEVLSESSSSKTQGKILINETSLIIGEKLFGTNGFKLKVNDKWYIAKNNYTKDILYKDDNDLAYKQYLMVKNILNFKLNQIKLK